jgi:hypothetical protein
MDISKSSFVGIKPEPMTPMDTPSLLRPQRSEGGAQLG